MNQNINYGRMLTNALLELDSYNTYGSIIRNYLVSEIQHLFESQNSSLMKVVEKQESIEISVGPIQMIIRLSITSAPVPSDFEERELFWEDGISHLGVITLYRKEFNPVQGVETYIEAGQFNYRLKPAYSRRDNIEDVVFIDKKTHKDYTYNKITMVFRLLLAGLYMGDEYFDKIQTLAKQEEQ